MGYTVTSTTAPTITSSEVDVEPSIDGGVLGLTRIGIGQQAAAGDMVRVFGLVAWNSTFTGNVTLTIPLPFKAAAAPLCLTYQGPNAEVKGNYINFEYMTATANT